MKFLFKKKSIFLTSIIISFLFSLLLIPFVQNFVLSFFNVLFNTKIELTDLWKNRFIEHSIKSIFTILSAGSIIQFFKAKTIPHTQGGGITLAISSIFFFVHF